MAVSRTSPPRRQGRFSATESGKAAKRWHMTLLWQRGAACRWHPCCPYGAPSLHNLSDWLPASLDAAKAGSESPRQEPGHPFRWQQRHCCSDITVPRHGHTCPDVCERRPGGALWFLWEPLAEEGRKALQCRAGGTRFWREEGRSISFGNVGEWPFPLMRGRLFASSARFCNQDSERDSGDQDICKTEERSVCACHCCQQGKTSAPPETGGMSGIASVASLAASGIAALAGAFALLRRRSSR